MNKLTKQQQANIYKICQKFKKTMQGIVDREKGDVASISISVGDEKPIIVLWPRGKRPNVRPR